MLLPSKSTYAGFLAARLNDHHLHAEIAESLLAGIGKVLAGIADRECMEVRLMAASIAWIAPCWYSCGQGCREHRGGKIGHAVVASTNATCGNQR